MHVTKTRDELLEPLLGCALSCNLFIAFCKFKIRDIFQRCASNIIYQFIFESRDEQLRMIYYSRIIPD